MLSRHERENIRASLVEMTRDVDNTRSPAVPGGHKRLTPHQMWQLLNALDHAEADNARLRTLVRKLYEIVNSAALTKCDHQSFTAETKRNLFAILAEAHAPPHREKMRRRISFHTANTNDRLQ